MTCKRFRWVQLGPCIADTDVFMNFKRPQVLSIPYFLILPKGKELLNQKIVLSNYCWTASLIY